MSPAGRVRAVALLLLPLLPSCLSFNWTRDRRFEPSPGSALEELEVGRSTLADCLLLLGAPLYVWEYKGNGAALAWGWSDEDSKGLALSVPVEQWIRPSISYQDIAADLRGPVLFFDEELVLQGIEEGYLRDYSDQIRRTRPASTEELEADSSG